ncbi:MAG: DUF1311 domain-containing protein [Rhodomicrobium sp.]|nr:DUF1311 domain-containing protein [Rhodomicrobium sp.]
MRILGLTAMLAALSGPAALAQTPNPIDCANASTTVEMNYCVDLEYQKADAALNEVYQQVLNGIRDGGGEAPYDPASWEKELVKAQRAWIAFRDADCKGLVPMEWSGGSGTTVAVLGCMIELTKERTRILGERYEAR